MILSYIVTISISYLLGSIPFAVIIAKSKGVNILQEGSGNPGATNVKRVLGKTAGNTVFALDFAKGFLAVLLVSLLFGESYPTAPIVALLVSIIGHSFSVFLKFKGGKGVAVTMGGLLALVPFVLIAGLVTWLLLFYTTRYVSLASICFGLSLHLWALLFDKAIFTESVLYAKATYILLISLGLMILIRHKSNLERLISGKESKFTKK